MRLCSQPCVAVVGGITGDLWSIDADSGDVLRSRTLGQPVTSVAMSSNGDCLAVGSLYGRVDLIEGVTLEHRCRISLFGDGQANVMQDFWWTSLAFHPMDCKLVAAVEEPETGKKYKHERG